MRGTPEVGRWLSEDPVGFAAGDGNLNRYAGNSSLLQVDPSGLTSLNDQLLATWVSRAQLGFLGIPQWWTRRSFWHDSDTPPGKNNPFIFQDDGNVRNDTARHRSDFLILYAHAKGVPVDGKWHKAALVEKNAEIANAVDYIGDVIPVNSVPIIGRSASLEGIGTYEIKFLLCDVSDEDRRAPKVGVFYKAQVRNIDISWRLNDNVDLKGAQEIIYNDPKMFSEAGKLERAIIIAEGVGDFVADKLWAASFPFSVPFREKSAAVRQISARVDIEWKEHLREDRFPINEYRSPEFPVERGE